MAASGGSVIIGLAAYIAPFEGERLEAYQDVNGTWTICDGETHGVKKGDRATHAQCMAMLEKRVGIFLPMVDKVLPGLPLNRRLAYGDLVYNLGPGILTRRATDGDTPPRYIPGTSIVELERAGKWQQACERMRLFVYAGKKVYNGLVARRNDEVKLCLQN
jgi:lysozyme